MKQTTARNKLIFWLALALALFISQLPGMTMTAMASDPVTYLAATVDETTHAVTFNEENCNDYTVVNDGTMWGTEGNTTWYVVSDEITIENRITVTGDVHLILKDGATLNAKSGITVVGSDILTIYGQSGGSGILNAAGVADDENWIFPAGIGGYEISAGKFFEKVGGNIIIHGGKITTVGASNIEYGYSGAGIGGCLQGLGGDVIIYGGNVTATGGMAAAGIGGGAYYIGDEFCNVTIYGGTVTASGGEFGAGIGGSYGGHGVNVTINGGNITAIGGTAAAGIGDGAGYAGDRAATITINGGTVTATGGNSNDDGYYHGAGIGGGYNIETYNAQTNNTLNRGRIIIGEGVTVLAGSSPNPTDSGFWLHIFSQDYHAHQYVITKLSFLAVENVTFDKAETALAVGDVISLTVTVSPSDATDKRVKWSVSDDSKIKLYSDAECTEEIGSDAISTLTVYAKGISVGESTITVTATNGTDDIDDDQTAMCTVTVNKADPQATDFSFTGPTELTYNGDPKIATVSPNSNVIGMGAVTVEYYSNSSYESSSKLSEPPVNAGTWYVGITVAEGENYNAASTVLHGDNWQFTIQKDAAPAVTVPTPDSVTYDPEKTLADITLTGDWNWTNNSTVPTVGNSGYEADLSVDDDNYDYTGVEGYNAETHKVTRTIALTVNKADPTVTAPAGLAATYGQTLADVTLTNPDGNIPGTWGWKDHADTSVGNAGSNKFTAIFTPEDTANYNSIEKEVTLTVKKADPSVTPPAALTATYGQTLDDVTLTNPEGNIPGTWEWADPGTTDVGTPGEHTFTARFTPEDTANYNSIDVSLTVTVGKASNPANVTDSAAVRKGGNTVDLANNIELNGAAGAVSYEIPGDKNGCTISGSVLTSGSDTGTVEVKATIASDANYEALEKTITVTITDKEIQTISVDADPVTAAFGETGRKISAAASGGGMISYAVKEGSANFIEVDPTTGELTIKAVPADGKAYVIVTAAATETYEAASMDVTVEISKAEASAAAVEANSPAYDGTAQPLVTVTGTPTGGEMQYALSENSTTAPTTGWGTSIPTATDAGTYYVWYKVKGDENHSDSEPVMVPVMVAKAKTPAPDPDEALTVNYPEESLTAKEGYEVSSEPGGTATDPDFIAILDNDSNPTVYVRAAGDGNHEPSEWVPVPLVPRPAAPEGLSPTNAANGTSADGSITGVDSTIEYSDDNGTTWKDVPSDTISGLNPGTYQVRVKATDAAPAGKTTEVTVGNDYRALDDSTPVTINKDGKPIGDAAVEVGDELTADCEASDVVYQWYRGDDPVDGAVDPTYTVTDEDLGKTIKVRVTQTKKADGSEYAGGTEPSKESSPTSAVTEEGDLEAYKERAKAELAAYRDSKDNADYDEDGIAALDAVKEAGDNVIDQALNREAVDAALSAAKARLDAVQPTGQEYTIDVTIVGEGKVDVDVVVSKTIAAAARPGDTVMLNVIPGEGYKLNRLTYVPEGGASVNITAQKQFTMPAANVKVVAVFVKESDDRDGSRDHMNFFRFENADALPKTGLSAVYCLALDEKPLDLIYQPLHWTLEVPSASIATGIVSVPYADGEYPVTWLGADAGLLEGSALPGFGQAVITGHNHLNTSAAGPFAGLNRLKEGDRVFVRDERGAIETFVVYANAKVAESDIDAVNELISADPLSLTLITCEDERPEGGYANRRVIAAKPL